MNTVRTILLFILLAVSHFHQAQQWSVLGAEIGFDIMGLNRGVAIADYDNDGWEDIYFSVKDGPNLLFKNLGNFQFIEVAEELGLANAGNTLASVWIDIENDGDLDLFCGNQFQKSRLYIQENGSFYDRTNEFGIDVNANIQSVNAIDYNNDGLLDIYLAAFERENYFLQNEGTHFTDVIADLGISSTLQSMGAIFFDADQDGDADLYQTHDGNKGNEFFRNEGDGTFRKKTASTGTGYKGQGMGVDVGDINGDGALDIYFTNLFHNILYLRKGDEYELSFDPLLNDDGMGWGTFIFDADNDSDEDIFIANDSHFQVDGINYANQLLLNQGDMSLTTLNQTAVQTTDASYGAATADLNKDGLLDIVIANSVTTGNQILVNESDPANYISVALEGVNSNRQGIGATVYAYLEDKTLVKNVSAGSSYASQSSSILHFGLGDISVVDSIVVQWPSGIRQTILGVDANQRLEIIEQETVNFNGPLVWTDPPFPTQLDDITLYFDAREGNGALAGFEGDVYAHTGVITSESTAPNDWKHVQGVWGTPDATVLMERVEDDVYSLEYNITDYYGINEGEIVEQLAFVFRNSNGGIVGRDTDGSDIFHDVYEFTEGFLVNLISPASENTVIYQGEDLLIQLQSNLPGTLEIYDNESLIFTGEGTDFEYAQVGESLGEHQLRFVIFDEIDTAELTSRYFVIDANEDVVDLPSDVHEGINYTQDGNLLFRLTAPLKEHVFILCPWNEYKVDVDFRMQKTTDGDNFLLELPTSYFADGNNTYQYLIDGVIKVADPFSSVVLDPWNDAGVPADVMDELPDYPEGLTTGIVSVVDTEPLVFDWQSNDFEKPANDNLIIYEILMRDFVEDRNYKSLLDSLTYLKGLGVNAIQLMPIQEFEGNQSWGYNPSFHMAVDKYYGSRDQLKRLIDEAHGLGIAVILDVVFNHAFSQSPLCQMYWDPTLFRPTPESPYLNEEARHPFNVGYDFNHESPYTKDWVKRVLTHWIEEYRFDGFRFDLSKGFTQKFSGSNIEAWSQYDFTRVGILDDYASHIWSLDPESYVIMEHFAVNEEESDMSDLGMMIWGNMTHQFAEAAMGYGSNLGWADYTERGWDDPNLIAYMESHDEERMGYKLITYGNENQEYSTKDIATGAERLVAASVIYMSIPGPKMLWQFGELVYDYSINRCVNGSINPDCRLDPKPVRWDYFEDERRKLAYDKLAALHELRQNYPVFRTRDFEYKDVNAFVKSVSLTGEEMDVFALANFRITPSDASVTFPSDGIWYDYFTGDSISLDQSNVTLSLDVGEYRLYTSEKLAPPNGFFTTVHEKNELPFVVFPNPSHRGQNTFIQLESDPRSDWKIEVWNADGKRSMMQSGTSKDIELQTKDLGPGIYMLMIFSDDQIGYKKLIIHE